MEPADRVSEELLADPSTVMVTVPEGVVVDEEAPEATAIVMTSSAPKAGDVVAGERVVVELMRLLDVLAEDIQAVSNLYRSTDPRPVASSYPVVAVKLSAPAAEQYW